jgi:hypothetical protein
VKELAFASAVVGMFASMFGALAYSASERAKVQIEQDRAKAVCVAHHNVEQCKTLFE